MADGQAAIDAANSAFWDTLCGSWLAQSLGVTDSSPQSLKRFDDWYLGVYPYLNTHIPFAKMAGKRVLEVGLGYGTVAQLIAEAGADYCGMDIAQGPVDMANLRLKQKGLPGRALCGSILETSFEDASFDFVVSIGCLHHTGNLQRALDEVRRVLKPGGTAVIMVYNGLSYRRWVQARGATGAYWLWSTFGIGDPGAVGAADRGAYDADLAGNAAPETAFVSVGHLRRMCSKFSSFSAKLENIDQEKPFENRPRSELLGSIWPGICGLDIYATVVK
jgi:SAM-dependent methyltransferase